MSEQWRPIPGYEGRYDASSEGRIRSRARVVFNGRGEYMFPGKIMRSRPSRGGYLRVTLCAGSQDQKASWLVHVLVLSAFVGPRPPGLLGLHNDGDRLNNKVENLRWGTFVENALDSVRHGTQAQARQTHCKHGHPFDEANTIRIPPSRDRGPRRRCRTCNNAIRRARRRRQKAVA